MSDYHEPIHDVMGWDEALSLINVFHAMADDDRDSAREFIKTHSNLNDASVDDFYRRLDSGDPNEEESLEILCRAQLLRTHAEIMNAWNQVWHRRWWLRRSDDPASVGLLAEMELAIPDINNPKYRTDYGAGYLAGVASALGWVTGSEWGMLDT